MWFRKEREQAERVGIEKKETEIKGKEGKKVQELILEGRGPFF